MVFTPVYQVDTFISLTEGSQGKYCFLYLNKGPKKHRLLNLLRSQLVSERAMVQTQLISRLSTWHSQVGRGGVLCMTRSTFVCLHLLILLLPSHHLSWFLSLSWSHVTKPFWAPVSSLKKKKEKKELIILIAQGCSESSKHNACRNSKEGNWNSFPSPWCACHQIHPEDVWRVFLVAAFNSFMLPFRTINGPPPSRWQVGFWLQENKPGAARDFVVSTTWWHEPQQSLWCVESVR